VISFNCVIYSRANINLINLNSNTGNLEVLTYLATGERGKGKGERGKGKGGRGRGKGERGKGKGKLRIIEICTLDFLYLYPLPFFGNINVLIKVY
jgi:hypothetical protein